MLWLAGTAGLVVLLSAAFLFARWQFVIITVEGVSMLPTLGPGERILVHLSRRRVRRGRIVLLQQPDSYHGWDRLPLPSRNLNKTRWYVKRVVAQAGDPVPEQLSFDGIVPVGCVALLGDHPQSIDSRQHGLCPVGQVIGVVIARLPTRHSRTRS